MDKIELLKVYPQPPVKGCRPCYDDNPNYAREAQVAADEAANASVLAMRYAQEAKADLNNYYDKEETDALLADKADITDLNDYYDKDEVDNLLDDKMDIDSMNAYYTKTAIDALMASKKDLQTAKSSPSASSTTNAFIDTIIQNEQGVITATKKTVRSASASQTGLMSSAMYTKLNNLPSDAYSKTEADTLLDGKINTSELGQTIENVSVSWGGISGTAQVRKSIEYTELKFTIGNNTAPTGVTGNDIIGTLPEKYRPSVTRYFLIVGKSEGGWTVANYYPVILMIDTAGVMHIIGKQATISTYKYMIADIFYMN